MDPTPSQVLHTQWENPGRSERLKKVQYLRILGFLPLQGWSSDRTSGRSHRTSQLSRGPSPQTIRNMGLIISSLSLLPSQFSLLFFFVPLLVITAIKGCFLLCASHSHPKEKAKQSFKHGKKRRKSNQTPTSLWNVGKTKDEETKDEETLKRWVIKGGTKNEMSHGQVGPRIQETSHFCNRFRELQAWLWFWGEFTCL